MQGYRTAPSEDPRTQGPFLCQADGCQQVATLQTLRHATIAQYAALPEAHRPIDGLARMAVFACDDHGEDAFEPFCQHPLAPPVPCPACAAAGDEPCAKKSGGPRFAPHAVRIAAQPVPDSCLHAHREDCGVFEDCRCTAQDLAPNRPPRPRGPAPGPDVTGMNGRVSLQQALLFAESHGVDMALAQSVRDHITQDNRPALQIDLATVDAAGNWAYDEHGHLITETRTIPLDSRPGNAALRA